MSSPGFRLAVLIAMLTVSVATPSGATQKIRLISASFSLPFKLQVEGAGTERVFAMNPMKCSSSQCPPIVMAWECYSAAEPNCANLNRHPPKDLCGATTPSTLSHSPKIRETRWICPNDSTSEGQLQIGFSLFDLEHGQVVVSYLGSISDMSPSEVLDVVAKTMRAN
jgi:hypothetical protein